MPTSKQRQARGKKRATAKQPVPMSERVARIARLAAFDKTKAYCRQISPLLTALREACAKHGLPMVVGVCYVRGPAAHPDQVTARLHIEATAARDGWQPSGIRRAARALRSSDNPISSLLAALGAGDGSLMAHMLAHSPLARSISAPSAFCGDCTKEINGFLDRAMVLATSRRFGAKWVATTTYSDCHAAARGRGPTRKTALSDLRADLASWARRQLAAGVPLPGQLLPRPNPAWFAAEQGFAAAQEERERGEKVLCRVLRGERPRRA